MTGKKLRIYPAHASNHNSKGEKQVILLMIQNKEEWHYLTIKKLSALIRGKYEKIMMVFIF